MAGVKKGYTKQYFNELDSLSWKRIQKGLGPFEEQFLQLLNVNNQDTILDTGCGTGWHIFNYGVNCGFVVGVDISRVGLKRASERLRSHNKYANVQVLCADAQKLPFRARCFTKVLCVSLVEHLEYPQKFLSEVYRVLEEDGLVVIGTPNRIDPVYRALEFMAKKTKRSMPLIGRADDTHQRLFTLSLLRNSLKACGLVILETKVQYSLLGMKAFGGDLVISARKTARSR